MEEVHEEIGYWFVNTDSADESEYEYINQYKDVTLYTMAEFNFVDCSDEYFHQLAVF